MRIQLMLLFFVNWIMEKIIYKNDQGNLSIIMPTQEALQHMSIYEIAKKDVPTGKNFRIIKSIQEKTNKIEKTNHLEFSAK